MENNDSYYYRNALENSRSMANNMIQSHHHDKHHHDYDHNCNSENMNLQNMQSMQRIQNLQNMPDMQILTPGITNSNHERPENLTNPSYMPSYLSTQVGRWMNVDMLAGNSIERQTGQLLHVGSDYIVLRLNEPMTTFICQMDAIRFITIIYHNDINRLLMP